MKKALLVTIVALITLFTATAGENRLKSLGAKSPMGSYLTPDSWCDPFYVNPAFAASNDSFLVMQENSLGVGIVSDTMGERGTELKLLPLHRFGLFLPYKNFRWGGEFTYTRSYYDHKYTDTTNFVLADTIFLDGKTLFAWQVKEALSIGFLLGGGGKIYDNYDYYYTKSSLYYGSSSDILFIRKRDYISDLSYYSNFGLLFKKGGVESAFALPFRFNYRKLKNSIDYVSFANDWGKTGIKLLFDIGLDNVTTINFNEDHFLRINSRLALVAERVNHDYNSYFYPGGRLPTLTYSQFKLEEKLALTMHHYLKNRQHMILYGLEVTGYSLFGTGMATYYNLESAALDSYRFTANLHGLTLSTNFGGSFGVNDKLKVNFGVDTLIITTNFDEQALDPDYFYAYLIQESGELPYYDFFKYPKSSSYPIPVFATNLNLGFDIRPVKGFTIEAGLSLNGLSPLLAVFVSGTIIVAPRVDLAFTWDISELKGKKTNDDKSSSDEL